MPTRRVTAIEDDGGLQMAWFFEGTGTQLGFSISETGNLSAYGRCSQFCRPETGSADIFPYVSRIEGGWSLHSSDAPEYEYDGAGRGLKAFFAQNEGRAAALIEYSPRDKEQAAIVGASILVPRSAMQDALSLLTLAFGNPSIKYVITLSFMGLRDMEGPPSTIPNVAEFVDPDVLRRRAYLSGEVDVSVLAAKTPQETLD
jgi:hypothetical protein